MSPPDQEFGHVNAVELKRLARRGSMQPLLCRADDDRHYILKPYSSGGSWPLVLEWTCARIGRAVGLPIPNYRQVHVAEELAQEWNAFNDRRIEPGPGFGSHHVPNALEFEVTLADGIPDELRLRVLAFDWWIRNHDRGEKNPNLLWSAETRALHVIDHDQAAQISDATIFWGTHLFKALARADAVWLPPNLALEFERARASLFPSTIEAELPSAWTSGHDGLRWFARQLECSLPDASHRDWRNHD